MSNVGMKACHKTRACVCVCVCVCVRINRSRKVNETDVDDDEKDEEEIVWQKQVDKGQQSTETNMNKYS